MSIFFIFCHLQIFWGVKEAPCKNLYIFGENWQRNQFPKLTTFLLYHPCYNFAIVPCLWAEMPICLQSWHVCELILHSNDFLHRFWGVFVVFKKHICLIANSQDDQHQSVDYKSHLGKWNRRSRSKVIIIWKISTIQIQTVFGAYLLYFQSVFVYLRPPRMIGINL